MKRDSNRIYKELRNKILTCQYKPSDLIFEKDLVEEYGVSRTPIREAINMLSGEGLLSIIPKKGIQINQVSIKKLNEIAELRRVLEPIAIRLAIQNLNEEDIIYLESLIDKFDNSVISFNAIEFFEYGMEIHLFIAKKSNNETLFTLLKYLREQSYCGTVYYFTDTFQSYSEEQLLTFKNKIQSTHKKIVEHLIKKDTEMSIQYLLEDLNTARFYIHP